MKVPIGKILIVFVILPLIAGTSHHTSNSWYDEQQRGQTKIPRGVACKYKTIRNRQGGVPYHLCYNSDCNERLKLMDDQYTKLCSSEYTLCCALIVDKHERGVSLC